MELKSRTSAQNALDLSFEENSLLHGIIRSGKDGLIEVLESIKESSFQNIDNKLVFSALVSLFNNGKDFGTASIVSVIGENNTSVLDDIFNVPPANKNELKDIAKCLKSREIIKASIEVHRAAIDKLHLLSARDPDTKIFSVSETALFDLIQKFSDNQSEIIELKNVVEELVDYWKSNPTNNVGLPTPWPLFNESIGGGMRTGVTLIGSRSGVGKTSIAIMIANFLASNYDIPVLILDTEMEHKDILPRMLANLSEVDIRKIETGQFSLSDFENSAVSEAVKAMKSMPISYKSIAGKNFDEIMSIVRRWIYTSVGLTKEGKAKQCLVIYDYFKLMDSTDIGEMAEYQAMGFQISKLTDFCKVYDIPCLSFVQLNRDGVAKEGTDVIAQSDRLLWLTNSFSLFKPKSLDEIEKDGPNNGNRKMITLKSRYGGEHSYGQYISMQWKGSICSLTEVQIKDDEHPTSE
jgi:replicative DNA helicase